MVWKISPLGVYGRQRFVKNLQNGETRKVELLSAKYRQKAHHKWIQSCQRLTYAAEIANLPSRSSTPQYLVRQLHLLHDCDSVIRCGRRSHNAFLIDSAKFPYLLPPNHPPTALIVCDTRRKQLRSSVNSNCTSPKLLDTLHTSVRQKTTPKLCNLSEARWRSLQSPRSCSFTQAESPRSGAICSNRSGWDTPGTIQKIAKFIGKELSQEILEGIINQTSFNAMKKEENVNYTWLPGFKGEFIRKGQVGDWKNYFTEEQNKRLDFLYAEKMAGSGLEFEFDL
ncbi:hypothetical protein ACROYT_G001242 [Oculina patagonica]